MFQIADYTTNISLDTSSPDGLVVGPDCNHRHGWQVGIAVTACLCSGEASASPEQGHSLAVAWNRTYLQRQIQQHPTMKEITKITHIPRMMPMNVSFKRHLPSPICRKTGKGKIKLPLLAPHSLFAEDLGSSFPPDPGYSTRWPGSGSQGHRGFRPQRHV